MSDDISPEPDNGSLGGAIKNAILEWCNSNGGFPIAFVCALDLFDSDGEGCLVVSEMDDQPTHRSMGLSTYLDAWYRDDATNTFASLTMGELDE